MVGRGGGEGVVVGGFQLFIFSVNFGFCSFADTGHTS